MCINGYQYCILNQSPWKTVMCENGQIKKNYVSWSINHCIFSLFLFFAYSCIGNFFLSFYFDVMSRYYHTVKSTEQIEKHYVTIPLSQRTNSLPFFCESKSDTGKLFLILKYFCFNNNYHHDIKTRKGESNWSGTHLHGAISKRRFVWTISNA